MTFGEVKTFLTGFNLRNREAWEQTRIIGYIIAQSNSTKKLEQTDILRFPWDEEDKEAATVHTGNTDGREKSTDSCRDRTHKQRNKRSNSDDRITIIGKRFQSHTHNDENKRKT